MFKAFELWACLRLGLSFDVPMAKKVQKKGRIKAAESCSAVLKKSNVHSAF